MHMQRARFAKGLLAPAGTMFRGARSRTPEICFMQQPQAHPRKLHVSEGLPTHVTPNDAKILEKVIPDDLSPRSMAEL